MSQRRATVLAVLALCVLLLAPLCAAHGSNNLGETETQPRFVRLKHTDDRGVIIPPLPEPPEVGVPAPEATSPAVGISSAPVGASGQLAGAGASGFAGAYPGAGSFLSPRERVEQDLRRVIRRLYD